MISIIVPIYNAANYLDACLESLQKQTERNLQIILIDDESTDASVAIAQKYVAKDPCFELYEQKHAGQSVARNWGMSKAKGEYIAFVDADDAIEPDWCARHLVAIDGVDYVQSGYKRVQQAAVKNQKYPCHRWQFTSPCMRLYRRQMISNIPFAQGMIYEDVLFSTDLWLSNATCRIIDYTGYLYTLNPESTTSVPHQEARELLFNTLKGKAHSASLKGKMIILYTLIRLHLHFLRS